MENVKFMNSLDSGVYRLPSVWQGFYVWLMFVFIISFGGFTLAQTSPGEAPDRCVIDNPSFETGDLSGWIIEGDAFDDSVITAREGWDWGCCFEQEGAYLAWGYHPRLGDLAIGEIRSSTFTLCGIGEISFLIGGGYRPNLYVALIRASDNEELMRSHNEMWADDETLRRVVWDASDHLGEELYLKVVDREMGGWGHINVDDFRVYNTEETRFRPEPLEPLITEIDNPNFETGDLNGWTTSGRAFRGAISSEEAPEGQYHLWSGINEPGLTGEVSSALFTLSGTGVISFLIAGDSHEDLYVALMRSSDRAELFRTQAPAGEEHQRVIWDASAFLGEEVIFKIVDRHSGEGAISVDDVRVKQLGMVAYWSFNEGAGKEVLDQASGRSDTIHYVFNEARFKPPSDPLWRMGIVGSALLFDGYSTFIVRDARSAPYVNKAFTIEAWVAPRSFEWGARGQLSAIVNQHDRRKAVGYLLGVGRHGRWGFQVGLGGEWYKAWAQDGAELQRDTWSHIAAVFDGPNQAIYLYLNGRRVGEAALPENAHINLRTDGFYTDFIIGQHNDPAIINDVFAANMFNGLIDNLRIYSYALSSEEVAGNFAAYGISDPTVLQPDTAPDRSRFDGDLHRPQFHFIAPEHWMNEPHAPLHFAGKYHIFYQHNPHGPYWAQIHWGHAVSYDMVHWRDLPIALAPEKGSVAPDGVWSGSAVLDPDGNPALLFTAGDDSRVSNQSIGLARSTWKRDGDSNLVHWEMHPELVIEQDPDLYAPEGEVWFGQFRDPFVWYDEVDGRYYVLITSGIVDVGGTALLYSSEDLLDWTYHGPFFVGDVKAHPRTGEVWELPVFLPLGEDASGREKYLFLINPWWSFPSPHNVQYVWYWIGEFDREALRFVPDHEEPRLLDYGAHFTGPSGMVDEHGRSIVFSIAQGRRSYQDHFDAGWAHNAGLPIVVWLGEDGDLRFAPIPELEALRAEKLLDVSDKSFEEVNELLESIKGDMLEIRLELEPGASNEVGLHVRRSPGAEEQTLLFYDVEEGTFNINRNRTSLDPTSPKGILGGPLDLADENLRLHIYLDKSMLQAYANNKRSITSRIYATREDALGLRLWQEPEVSGARVVSMQVWRLNSAY